MLAYLSRGQEMVHMANVLSHTLGRNLAISEHITVNYLIVRTVYIMRVSFSVSSNGCISEQLRETG